MIFQSKDGAYIRVLGEEVLRIEPPTFDEKGRVEISDTSTLAEADTKYRTEQDAVLAKFGYHSYMHAVTIKPLEVTLWIGPVGTKPLRVDWWTSPKLSAPKETPVADLDG